VDHLNRSQQTSQQPKPDQQFDRGTDLTLFSSDRQEDWVAIVIAFAIAFGIVAFISI